MGTWGRSSSFACTQSKPAAPSVGPGRQGTDSSSSAHSTSPRRGGDAKIERRHKSRRSAQPREDQLSIGPVLPSCRFFIDHDKRIRELIG